MTQEQFSSLQELHRLSGLSLVKFLQREHVSYSTYNYWKRKSSSVPDHETSAPQSVLAPISLKSPCIASSSSVSGMTLRHQRLFRPLQLYDGAGAPRFRHHLVSG